MISLAPIATVSTPRTTIQDDDWGDVVAEIQLVETLPPSVFDGIEAFSHLEIIFYFDRVPVEKIVAGARYPRGNTNWPKVGIFAQRGKNRPNRLGSTTVKLLERKDRALVVQGLDAINGTPVVDIKPVMREFQPTNIQQPLWATELMKNYW